MSTPKPLRCYPSELPEAAIMPWWQRAAVRAKLWLQLDPQASRAWQQAAKRPALARQLTAARIPVPCDETKAISGRDPVQEAWLALPVGNADRSVMRQADGTSTWLPWLQSLPATQAGQHWRNRAMWVGLHYAKGPLAMQTAVRSGADVQALEDACSPFVENPGSGHGALTTLLRYKQDYGSAIDKIGVLVAHGMQLTTAAQRLYAHAWTMAPFSPQDLNRLIRWGLDVTDAKVASACMSPWVNDPEISGAGDLRKRHQSLEVLLQRGMPIDAPDARGNSPLQRFLATQRGGSYLEAGDLQTHVWHEAQWFVDQGASLLHRNQSGQTLLHTSMAGSFGPGLRPEVWVMLTEACPSAWDEPYSRAADKLSHREKIKGRTPRQVLDDCVTTGQHLTSVWPRLQETAQSIQDYLARRDVAGSLAHTLEVAPTLSVSRPRL